MTTGRINQVTVPCTALHGRTRGKAGPRPAKGSKAVRMAGWFPVLQSATASLSTPAQRAGRAAGRLVDINVPPFCRPFSVYLSLGGPVLAKTSVLRGDCALALWPPSVWGTHHNASRMDSRSKADHPASAPAFPQRLLSLHHTSSHSVRIQTLMSIAWSNAACTRDRFHGRGWQKHAQVPPAFQARLIAVQRPAHAHVSRALAAPVCHCLLLRTQYSGS